MSSKKTLLSVQIILIGMMFAIMLMNRFFLKDIYFTQYNEDYNVPIALHLIRIKTWKMFSAIGIILTFTYYIKFLIEKYNLLSWSVLHTMALSGIWIFFFPNTMISIIHIITISILIVIFTI